MRTYEQANPWLTFEFDIRKIPYPLWLLLGEAQSLCELVAGTPLHPETARRLARLYRARGVLATAAIAGNTLREAEAVRLLDGDLELPESQRYLADEIRNLATLTDELVDQFERGEPTSLTPGALKRFNTVSLAALPPERRLQAGVIRDETLITDRYDGAPAGDCEFLVMRFCQWLNAEFSAPDRYGVAFGILKAIAAHVYLEWIRPFDDGNGRVARLAEMQILLGSGVPAMSAHLFGAHYHLTQTEYRHRLVPTSDGEEALLHFAHYAIRGFVDGLRRQMATIREEQLRVHWDDFVRLRFQGIGSAAARRKHLLVVDLSTSRDPVPVSELRHISPQVAEAYAGKSSKTLTRDLNSLEEMGLIERAPGGVRTRIELMRAYLPAGETPRTPSGRLIPQRGYDADPDRTASSSFA